MCGRFANAAPPDLVKARFKLTSSTLAGAAAGQGHNAQPRWNIAPTMAIDTIIRKDEGMALSSMQWGIASAHSPRPLINARAETMFEKPTFAAAAGRARCVVVASGWYEWKAPKQPYFMQLPETKPMALAGLFWQEEGGRRCVIVTTSALGALAEIHHRSPVVLDDDGWQDWLDPGCPRAAIESLTRPQDGTGLRWHPVTAEVGSIKADHPGLVERADGHGRQPAAQMDLF